MISLILLLASICIVSGLKSDPNARIFTLSELRKYDGNHDQKEIYLAVKGIVFDVTASGYYSKGSGYAVMAGREISKATALFNLDESLMDQPIDDLTTEQLKKLDDIYKSVYEAKYDIVGRLDSMPSTSPFAKVSNYFATLELKPMHVVFLGLFFVVSLLFYLFKSAAADAAALKHE